MDQKFQTATPDKDRPCALALKLLLKPLLVVPLLGFAVADAAIEPLTTALS